MAIYWSNPYGFSMAEWFAFTLWQRFKLFLWRHRYQRGYACLFLRDRARAEFLGKSLKSKDYRCKCSRVGKKGFCWCRCTPDGTLWQGVDDKIRYIRKEAGHDRIGDTA